MGKTVKARKHHGADSLDITIPADIVRRKNISSGDIFEIEIEEETDQIILKYKRVYNSD